MSTSSRARSPSFAPIPAERLLTLGCSPLIPGEVPGAHLQDGRDVVQVPGLPAQGKLQEEARVRKEEEKLEKVRGLDTFAVGGAILGISSLHLSFSRARAPERRLSMRFQAEKGKEAIRVAVN